MPALSAGRWRRPGVRRIRVVLSHWHLDHVAGNAVFADCEIIAHALTDELLREHRAAIEAGTHAGAPAIDPLVLPTTTYEGTLALEVGGVPVELRHVDIHSRDGTVLVLPGRGCCWRATRSKTRLPTLPSPRGSSSMCATSPAWPAGAFGASCPTMVPRPPSPAAATGPG